MFNTLPTRFRHYEVQKLLGSGGFGAVYLARDTKLKRLVVLKTLHAHLAAQPAMVRRFLREAQAMARLDHANIVRVNRVEDDPQLPFFEMEYVEGETLAAYRRGRVLPLPEVMPILKQMAAALDAAHRHKMVHRDVKPGNVLIKPDGTVKLTDFGIIKLLEATGTVHPSTGGIIGTPVYMAPEQADLSRKHEIGPATDIYALAVMTYQLLTGHLPFEGHPHSVLAAHANQAPPDPRQFNRYLSAQVAQVLLQALHKQPLNRYPSAMAFVDALERAALGGTAPPPPPVSGTFTATPSGNTPSSSVTPPLSWQSPPATPTSPSSPSAISKQMMVGFVVVILVAMIVGGLLREAFSTSPEPEPAIAQATLTLPAEEPEAATATPVPVGVASESTAAPEQLTATSVSLTATSVSFTATPAPTKPATATSIPPTATAIPPTATPTRGIGSTMPGQDGMTLLYVPAGEFLRGSKEDDPDADSDEHPQRSIYLDAFWIDETEVTNEMFAAFLNQQGNQVEGDVTWLDIEDSDALISESGGAFEPKEGFANHPVIEVTWYGAKAYCESSGRRLPTEAEWEKAARGTDGRTYPWGNESVAGNLVNLCDKNCEFNGIESIDDGYARTAPVGTYPDGASPYGALDMAGNVWEWANDWRDADYYHDAPERNPQGPDTGGSRVLRGGSWFSNEARIVRAGDRYGDDPAVSYDSRGFRCARSP